MRRQMFVVCEDFFELYRWILDALVSLSIYSFLLFVVCLGRAVFWGSKLLGMCICTRTYGGYRTAAR